MSNIENLVDKEYDLLTVVSYAYKKNGRHYWNCRCDCGNYTAVSRSNLVGRKVRSCGCLRHGIATHGMANTRIYTIWVGMKSRCYDVNFPKYKNYGARGITVCDRWKNSFEAFYEDMGKSYEKHVKEFGEANTSIDRINVDGNYCLDNCRWSTNIEQGNNTTTNHYITYNGETKTLIQWARELDINYGTLKCRINRYRWGIEKAFTTPVKGRKRL